MNRYQDDIRTIEKVKQIVNERFPDFASRYFNYNMYLKAPRSLYGYALDLTSFFEFLESIAYKADSMNIGDLKGITPQIIEDFLEYSRTYYKNGEKKERSLSALARRYSTLSAFFSYYYSHDIIDRNPVSKVAPPRPSRNTTYVPSNEINFDMIDHVMNGHLGGRMDEYRVHTQKRDIAIILLIMGAGLKGSEVVNLNIEDVDIDDNSIIVRSRKSSRTVFVSDTISRSVGQYLEERLDIIAEAGDDNALFLSLQCKRMCLRAVQKMIRKYSSTLFEGKDHLTAESLHLSFRNNFFDKTMNVKHTAKATGTDEYYVLRRYRGAVEHHESVKGTEFECNSLIRP